MNEYTGSCLCGAVKFKVRKPLKFVAHDHCSICRRVHGAAFVTWCGVKSETEQFQLLSGTENLRSYKSSKEAVRQFCGLCGTQIFFRSQKWLGEIHFTRASILEKMDELPKAHVFYSDKVSWYDCVDSLPKFGGTSGMEPIEKK